MKNLTLALPVAACLCTGCGMIEMVNESTNAVHRNRLAVERSTEVIRSNTREIEASTKVIEENRAKLEAVNKAMSG